MHTARTTPRIKAEAGGVAGVVGVASVEMHSVLFPVEDVEYYYRQTRHTPLIDHTHLPPL